MDTGSGKTMIAVARIKAELEICPVDKVREDTRAKLSLATLLMYLVQIVWFLAPTVTLVSQQHRVLAESLPAFQTRPLSGADGVDHWSTKSIWDEVLSNIRIVVSTHQVLPQRDLGCSNPDLLMIQVLLDALVHGFVRMSRLALLVFDEGMKFATELEVFFSANF